MSVTSRCSTETAKRIGSRKQRHTIAYRTLVLWCRRSWQNSNGVIPTEAPNAGRICWNWGLLTNNLQTCSNSKTLTAASVVNLVRSQVYYTEHPLYLFAARLPWYSASRGFVSDSWYLFWYVQQIVTPSYRVVDTTHTVLLKSYLYQSAAYHSYAICRENFHIYCFKEAAFTTWETEVSFLLYF